MIEFKGEPMAPGKPDIIDYDNESVKLKWTAPPSDGGATIEKYIIQKKDRYKPDWEKAGEVAGNLLEASVGDLKERGEYQFRIVAVNKGGQSPASEPTKLHLVKHKSLKPRIDRANLKQVTVKAGKVIKFDVNIKGEPAPTVALAGLGAGNVNAGAHRYGLTFVTADDPGATHCATPPSPLYSSSILSAGATIDTGIP